MTTLTHSLVGGMGGCKGTEAWAGLTPRCYSRCSCSNKVVVVWAVAWEEDVGVGACPKAFTLADGAPQGEKQWLLR